VKRVVGVDPVAAVADRAQKNFNRWKSLQDEVFRRFGGLRDSAASEEDSMPDDRKKTG
jgi:hypothetical protein